MPSSRRSQNLPLKDSLIPSSISSRSKKPSDKVKADVARKAKADVAARIIVEAAVKANTADAAVKANCLRNFKKHIIDNFKAAKKARKTHVAELQRRANAADHVKAQIEQEKRARSAEIARFDEEETLRRYREKREVRNIVDELSTLNIKTMKLKNRIADSTLKIFVCLRVNKRIEWSTFVETQTSSFFNIWDFEQLLKNAISKKDDHNKRWEITHWMINVRASRSKITWKLQFIDDFIEAEWNKMLEIIALKTVIEYDVRIELQIKFLKKKSSLKQFLNVLSFDSLKSSSLKATRITRIDKLLDRAHIRVDDLTAVDNFDRELLHHWQCIDKACQNFNDWCFIDFADKHFNINHTQQLLWDKIIIINDDDVTIERSSISLYRFWIDSQEEMTQNSWQSLMHQKRLKTWTDKEESKNFMSKFMRFNEQQLKMRLVKSMIEQMKRMTFRQRSSSSSLLISSSSQLQWQQSSVNSSYSTYQSSLYSQWQQSVSISSCYEFA